MLDSAKYINLCEMIKKLRSERGFSQVDLAEKLSVTKQCVSNWENGNILPSVEMLVKIASLFSVSTDYLLGFDDKKLIETSGLTERQILHLQMIVEDVQEHNNNFHSTPRPHGKKVSKNK